MLNAFFQNMITGFFHKPGSDIMPMAADDIEAITVFVVSMEGRDAAIEAYRRNLAVHARTNVYMKFMAEIDTVSPDLALRGKYRDAILALVP